MTSPWPDLFARRVDCHDDVRHVATPSAMEIRLTSLIRANNVPHSQANDGLRPAHLRSMFFKRLYKVIGALRGTMAGKCFS